MCAGGVIAFEIARQLRNQGEQVAMVALLDAADVQARVKSLRFASDRMRSFSSRIRQHQSVRSGRRVLSVGIEALRGAKNLSIYPVRAQREALRDAILIRLLRFYLDRSLSVPRLLRRLPPRAVYLFAEKTYRPAGPLDGVLHLFRATSGEGADEPYFDRYEDSLLGWGTRATGASAYMTCLAATPACFRSRTFGLWLKSCNRQSTKCWRIDRTVERPGVAQNATAPPR